MMVNIIKSVSIGIFLSCVNCCLTTAHHPRARGNSGVMLHRQGGRLCYSASMDSKSTRSTLIVSVSQTSWGTWYGR
jgi:hypothetical protein